MDYCKGPVKLIKRVKIAHSFLVCVKSVPRYHFKLAHVVLQVAVKKPTSKISLAKPSIVLSSKTGFELRLNDIFEVRKPV